MRHKLERVGRCLCARTQRDRSRKASKSSSTTSAHSEEVSERRRSIRIRRASRIGSIDSRRSLRRARLAITTELMSEIFSSVTRPFCRNVSPVSTRSTITSASPVSGASSTEPWQKISSTGVPLLTKVLARPCAGNLVATRRGRSCFAVQRLTFGSPHTIIRHRADVQIDRRKHVVVSLHQHVATDDAKVGDPVFDVRRDVVRLEEQPAAVRTLRIFTDELAAARGERLGGNAGLLEPRSPSCSSTRPFGTAMTTLSRTLPHASPATRLMFAPSGASFSSMCS